VHGLRLLEVIGRGGMAEVYRGTRDQDAFAVKVVHPHLVDDDQLLLRVRREAAIAARLPASVTAAVREVHLAGPGERVVVLDLLDGEDLAALLRRRRKLPLAEALAMMGEICAVVDAVHAAGVVHRDLKPQNLFLHAGPAGMTWKILDFGVSKVLGSEGTLTGEGIVGTPQYMAPEQASGGQVTHLADVYALGAIAYRCLTGRSPFKGRDLAELVYQVVHAAPLRPGALGRVSPLIEDVLAIAMAKDPRKRFSSALAFAQAFVAARRGKPVALDVPDNAWT